MVIKVPAGTKVLPILKGSEKEIILPQWKEFKRGQSRGIIKRGERESQVTEFTLNLFCATGIGGGIDSSCGKDSLQASDRFKGKTVGWREKNLADETEKEVASITKSEWETNNKFYDSKTKDNKHFIETKSKPKGSKTSITVHPDALLRKINGMKEFPGATFHTVVKDVRNEWEEGKHADDYSGNTWYYKRGSGAYELSQMHPVKNPRELKKLMKMSDDKLPEKARGSLPTDRREITKLKVQAAREKIKRQESKERRKAKMEAEGKSLYERQT
jgi:hypothetical protein